MEKEKWIKIAKLIGTTLAVYLVFKYLLPLVVPFVIAFLLAMILEKPVSFLEKRFHIKRCIGATGIVLSVLAILGVLLTILFSNIFKQVRLFVQNYDVLSQNFAIRIRGMCGRIDKMMGLEKGNTMEFLDKGMDSISETIEVTIIPSLVNKSIPILLYIIGGVGVIIITVIAVVLISMQMGKIKELKSESFFGREVGELAKKTGRIGMAYVRTQLIIMLITAVLCTVGFYIIKSQYPLLIGAVIGFLDALPLFGSGVILVPWTIVLIIKGQYWQAATIFTIYIVCYIIRQVLEPKLMGGGFGMNQLEMLISMYVGLLLFGIWGFLLGPVGYIIIRQVEG